MSTSSSAKDTEKAGPPPSRITVEMPDGDRELFMSFGLLNELASLVGGPEAVPNLSFDAQMSQTALFSVLVKRNKRGQPIDFEDEDDPVIPGDLSPETAEKILDWVAGHVLDFFVRRFANSVKLFGTQAAQLAEVGSSLTSSPNSAGKTRSS